LACRNNRCVSAGIGSSCETDTDCFSSNPQFGGTRCVNKRCIKPRYNGFGCSDNKHCYGDKCSGGVCSGIPYGQSCDPSKLSCEYGLYCSSDSLKCEFQRNEGDYCGDYFNSDKPENLLNEGSNFMIICKGGLKCSGEKFRKYCIRWRAGMEGSPCNRDRDGSTGCRFGLTCGENSWVCGNYIDMYPTYPCIGSTKNCTFSDEEDCICENGKGTCKRTSSMFKCNYIEVANQYRDCVEKNNCPFERNLLLTWELSALDSDTCIGRNCAGNIIQSMCCGFAEYSNIKYSGAQIGTLNCGNNLGPIIVIVLLFIFFGFVAIIAIFIIIAVALFFIMRKKKKQFIWWGC